MGTRTTIPDESSSALQVIQVERVSAASDGTEANSFDPSISADGRFVAYSSAHFFFDDDGINGTSDVFVFDRQTNTTERVSVASDNLSFEASISADGRFVSYTNSIGTRGFGPLSVAVFDRLTNTTTPVSGDIYALASSISADGRFVTYDDAERVSPRQFNSYIFLFDRLTNTTTPLPVPSGTTNDISRDASISADGRFVAYWKHDSYWAPDDDDTNPGDVFVFDQQTRTTELVSVASDGAKGNGASSFPSISADGRFVAYTSDATNLVPDDTNGTLDVFVFDRQTDTTSRVSVASDGTEANGPSGSPGDGPSGFEGFLLSAGVSISADGRFVVYSSDASNLVPGDTNGATDIFVFDRQTDTTTRVSVAGDGTEANGPSSSPSISADGHFVTYTSDASNLVPGDTNGTSDVFVAQIDVGPPVDGVVKDGDDGDNLLKGTHRNDILRGHGGNDRLFGHKGNDRLDAGDGNDKIFAGKGDDTILAGTGNDRIWTGKGSDLVVFNEGDGRDKIFGFDRHGHHDGSDLVQLNVSIGDNHIDDFAELQALIASGDIGLSTQKGSLTLTFDNGDALTLGGVHALSAEDWLFV